MTKNDKEIENIALNFVVAIIFSIILAYMIKDFVKWYKIPIKMTMWQWFGIIQIIQIIVNKKSSTKEIKHWSTTLFEGLVYYGLFWVTLLLISFLV